MMGKDAENKQASREDRVEARLIWEAMRDGFEGEEAVAVARSMKKTVYADHLALRIAAGDVGDALKQAFLNLRSAALKAVRR